MKRGEIRWYEFKSPDKKRPVLILTRSSAISYLNEITVAPVTSVIRDIPTEVVLDTTDGLKTICTANFDHLQTVAKRNIGKAIGKISPQKWPEVKEAIAFALELD